MSRGEEFFFQKNKIKKTNSQLDPPLQEELIRQFSRPKLFTEGLQKLCLHPEQAHLPLGPEIISSIIAQIADDVLTRQDVNHSISDEGRLLREFLEKQIFQPMPSLAEMARLLHRSEIQTTRIFRRDFGEPPYQYLLKRKLAARRSCFTAPAGRSSRSPPTSTSPTSTISPDCSSARSATPPAGTGAWSRPAK